MLVNAERQRLLGAATADDHGDLAWAILLPIDLTNGAYEVHVADTHHVATAALNIVPYSSGDEEGSQRGEDEPLLAPMPLPRGRLLRYHLKLLLRPHPLRTPAILQHGCCCCWWARSSRPGLHTS